MPERTSTYLEGSDSSETGEKPTHAQMLKLFNKWAGAINRIDAGAGEVDDDIAKPEEGKQQLIQQGMKDSKDAKAQFMTLYTQLSDAEKEELWKYLGSHATPTLLEQSMEKDRYFLTRVEDGEESLAPLNLHLDLTSVDTSFRPEDYQGRRSKEDRTS